MKINRVLVVGLSLWLVGCGTQTKPEIVHKQSPERRVGTVVGPDSKHRQTTHLNQDLANLGGLLVALGDNIRIILPADALFEPSKDKLKMGVEPTLLTVANYLKQFDEVCITIAGYSDAMPHRASRVALAEHRAQRVASFLWNQGFNEDCLNVKGYGQAEAIASDQSLYGRALNRRIEISLRSKH